MNGRSDVEKGCAGPASTKESDMGIQELDRSIDYDELINPSQIDGSLYTSDAVFAEELEKIWYKTWVYVGHSSEIPKGGDYVARKIGLQPVLMVRDRKGGINVVSNRCAHRGTQICNTLSGNARALVCPYHGWAYDLTGKLIGASHGAEYSPEFLAAKGLARAPRMGEYRGFVFASLAAEGPSLDEHLGHGKKFIDRLVEMSPEGEIELSAGWVRHKFEANWKMLYENDTDGYHPEFVHTSFMQAVSTQVNDYLGVAQDEDQAPVVRDWGNGHAELDWATGYRRTGNTFEWFGRVSPSRFPDYVTAMDDAYGPEVARQKLTDGPPHAIIFPNLFLAQLSVVMFEPVSPSSSVQWHCPLFLKGAPELNGRMIRQTEGAIGPSSFLVADDQIIAERNQAGLNARDPQWLDLSRGLGREENEPGHDGVLVGEMVSELTNRAFWDMYRNLMAGN
jgi:phenylpropionate dioxygenase-like ring-hydroxylating dioxygenase large terminal subunit